MYDIEERMQMNKMLTELKTLTVAGNNTDDIDIKKYISDREHEIVMYIHKRMEA